MHIPSQWYSANALRSTLDRSSCCGRSARNPAHLASEMTKLYQDQWHCKLRQNKTEVQKKYHYLLIYTNVWQFGTNGALVLGDE